MGADGRFRRARHDDGRRRSRARGGRASARRPVVHVVTCPPADLIVPTNHDPSTPRSSTAIHSARRASASSASATSGCRWRSNSRAPAFDVTGFDVDASKVAEINAGRSYIPDVPTRELAEAVTAGRLRATTDMAQLADMDVVDICVPTPLRKTKDPDLSYVVQALEARRRDAQAGAARHPRIDDLSGHDRRSGAADARGRGLKADAISSWRFRPSASTRATRSSRRGTSRRSSAARPGEHRGGRGALRADRVDRRARSARRASPRW